MFPLTMVSHPTRSVFMNNIYIYIYISRTKVNGEVLDRKSFRMQFAACDDGILLVNCKAQRILVKKLNLALVTNG